MASKDSEEHQRSAAELDPPPMVSPLSRLARSCHPKQLRMPAANSCCRQLLLAAALFLYLGFGAAVFSALERQEELQREQQMLKLLRGIAAQMSCSELLSNVTDQLAELLSSLPSGTKVSRSGVANRSLSLVLPTRWDFIGGVFFSMTAVTTIGYGNVAPSTNLGRVFCCAYAMFGIPLLAVFLGGVAARLKRLESRALRLKCWKARRRLGTSVVFVAYILVGFLLYFALPSLVFSYTEGWKFGVGMYYCFVTLSTIGFGDFIAGQQKVPPFPGYKLLLSMWIYTGLIYVSGCIGALQSAMERGAEALASNDQSVKALGSDDDDVISNCDNESSAADASAATDVVAKSDGNRGVKQLRSEMPLALEDVADCESDKQGTTDGKSTGTVASL